ncbi:hypothetical protein [Secundilactobacillus paracollinoides]|uniref:hypothetical protein n=1 Tax=Secundilactobacillus paracollinoides TaxID=240427 RepID=UPI0012EA0D1F|nr:hypothetical protein [Secundilactobacillus paracollinoides]
MRKVKFQSGPDGGFGYKKTANAWLTVFGGDFEVVLFSVVIGSGRLAFSLKMLILLENASCDALSGLRAETSSARQGATA